MDETIKPKMGRPPKEFKEEFCQMLIDHCSQGLSIESFCGIVEVCKETLYTWFEKYPNFLDAKNIAVSKSRIFWEKIATDNLINTTGPGGQSLNSSVWIFNMKNRFGWRDQQSVELSGKDGGQIPLTLAYAIPPKSSDEDDTE